MAFLKIYSFLIHSKENLNIEKRNSRLYIASINHFMMQNNCNKNVTILCRNLNMQVMEVSVENKKLSIVSDVLNLTTFVSLYE